MGRGKLSLLYDGEIPSKLLIEKTTVARVH